MYAYNVLYIYAHKIVMCVVSRIYLFIDLTSPPQAAVFRTTKYVLRIQTVHH